MQRATTLRVIGGVTLRKPKECQGCALFKDGLGFVRDRDKGGELTVTLPIPSAEAEAIGVGGFGRDWETIKEKYLPLAGQDPGEVNITHVIRCRYKKPKSGGKWYGVLFDGMFKLKEVIAAMHHCKVHDKEIEGEKLRVVMGEIGHMRYGGAASQDAPFTWRGHLAPEE